MSLNDFMFRNESHKKTLSTFVIFFEVVLSFLVLLHIVKSVRNEKEKIANAGLENKARTQFLD